MSLRTPKGKAIAIILGVIGLLIGGAILARYASAASGPDITLTVRDTSGASVTSAPIGSVVSANVAASSTASTTPSGTVNFSLYANTSCSGTPTTQSGVTLVGNAATSSTTTVGAAGLSYQAHYNGDANNAPSDSACVVVLPTSDQSSIIGALSATSVLAGSSVFESATLANVTQTASGTVAYTVYANSACTQDAQSAGVVQVHNGGVPNSNSLPFELAGTYYWQAVYSGDAQDSAATSSCAQLSVAATSTPVTPVTGSISGTVYNDQNANGTLDAGDTGIANIMVDIRSGSSAGAIVASAVTNGSGQYTFSALALGTYYVEELAQPQWQETTPAQTVSLSTSTPSSAVNFANIAATSTPNHHDGDADDSDHDEGGRGFAGIHFNFGRLTSALNTLDRSITALVDVRDNLASSTLVAHDHGLHLGELKHPNHPHGHQDSDDSR